MLNLISKSLTLFDRNIGRCSFCMKTAFICVPIGWLVFAAIHYLWPQNTVTRFAIALPIGLTALWLMHFVTYTTRVMTLLWAEYIGGRAPSARADGEYDAERRSALWVIGNAVTLSLFASVWLPSVAGARGHPCGRNRYCPDSAPNCCSRSQGKCCNGNWACAPAGSCHQTHAEARRRCGSGGTVLACT